MNKFKQKSNGRNKESVIICFYFIINSSLKFQYTA